MKPLNPDGSLSFYDTTDDHIKVRHGKAKAFELKPFDRMDFNFISSVWFT